AGLLPHSSIQSNEAARISNQHPHKPITTSQPSSIDRWLPFGNHDVQIAVTLGTGALGVLSHGLLLTTQLYSKLYREQGKVIFQRSFHNKELSTIRLLVVVIDTVKVKLL